MADNHGLKRLQKLLTLPDTKAMKYLARMYEWTYIMQGRQMFYLDKGSPVLAVAHLDTFFGEKQNVRTVEMGGDVLLFSPHIDDRVGVYVCLELLNIFEIDVLITTGEESFQSTAYDFTDVATHDYNWIVEFDRMGDDVVLYGYEDNTDLVDDLESVGFIIGDGSYSDICELESLETGAFNVGVGYYLQHTHRGFVSINTLYGQLDKFYAFYDQYFDKKYDHDPASAMTNWIMRSTGKGYYTYDKYAQLYLPDALDYEGHPDVRVHEGYVVDDEFEGYARDDSYWDEVEDLEAENFEDEKNSRRKVRIVHRY
jgi:hypothetical protein